MTPVKPPVKWVVLSGEETRKARLLCLIADRRGAGNHTCLADSPMSPDTCRLVVVSHSSRKPCTSTEAHVRPIEPEDRSCKTDLAGQLQVLGQEEAMCSLASHKDSASKGGGVRAGRHSLSSAILWLQFQTACCVSPLLHK